MRPWTPAEVAARRRRLAWGLAVAVAVAAAPQVGPLRNEFVALTVGLALISGLMGLSINVLTGYAGQISLGHGALYGTGAFATAHLMTLRGVPFWLALPLGALATGLVVLVMGFPALRVRGLHLAIVTLGFQFLMFQIVLRVEAVTGGTAGIDVERPAVGGHVLGLHREFLYVIVAVVAAVVWLDRNLTRTRAGRAFLAIREDEQVAASFGIDVARYKLMAFVLSGIYAGLAGGLFAVLIRQVTVEDFGYQPSLQFLTFAVIGGLGSRPGTMLGAMIPVFFAQIFSSLRSWSLVLGGGLLVLTLVRYRGGLAEQGREIRHLVRRALRRARGGGRQAGEDQEPAAPGPQHTPAGTQPSAPGPQHTPAGTQPSAPGTQPSALGTQATPPGPLAAGGGAILRRRARPKAAGPVLAVSGLSVRFGGVQALDGVSVEVREGEIVGLMGPNGAGKTTLFNCLSGFVRPERGTIRYRGRDITRLPPHRRALAGMGRTFQNIGLVKSETVLANLRIAQHGLAGYGPLEGMAWTAHVQRAERRVEDRARRVISLLGLEEVAQARVRDLPHGLLKTVELGCALVTGPELLLLDEPSSGMSPQEARELGGVLQRVRDAFGVTVFMIEHHVPLVLEVADYVYVLNFGRLLAAGEASEIARHPEVVAAYLGESEEALAGEAAS